LEPSAQSAAAGLKLNLAPHVPDDIVDSVLQQFQPALERPGIRHNGMIRKSFINNYLDVIFLCSGGDLNPILGFCFPLFSRVFPGEFPSG
jgi:hypothetical protein